MTSPVHPTAEPSLSRGTLSKRGRSRTRAPLGGELDLKPLYARRGDFGVDERSRKGLFDTGDWYHRNITRPQHLTS